MYSLRMADVIATQWLFHLPPGNNISQIIKGNNISPKPPMVNIKWQ